jgi:hypothetical protein
MTLIGLRVLHADTVPSAITTNKARRDVLIGKIYWRALTPLAKLQANRIICERSELH